MSVNPPALLQQETISTLTLLLHSGLGPLEAEIREQLPASEFDLQQALPGAALPPSDVFLLGLTGEELVRRIQEITARDSWLSIVVLTEPAHLARVRQALLFAPFIGKNHQVIAWNPQFDLATALRQAALRTRQRRSFSRISKTGPALTSLASQTLRVQNFSTFLEKAPVGALLLDDSGHVLGLNERAAELFGTATNRSYTVQDLFPGLSLSQLRAGQEGRALRVGRHILELHLSEAQGESGQVQHLALVNDVTERHLREAALAEREALFRFMAEAMPQKVWTANEQGELVFFNQHWVSYTGLGPDELQGWGWLNTIHPEDAVRNRAAWQHSIDTGTDFEFEQRIRRHDGAYRWHLVRGVPRKDEAGKIELWVGTNTDIHEQKAFAEELERRVGERTYELERSNGELEQFVYVTSHDLQEPLRKIRLFSELLRDQLGPLEPAPLNYLNKISNTALRMNTLLRELLRFTQLSREEQFVPVDLNDIVTRVVTDFELMIEQQEARVEIGSLPVLQAIPVQMHQLFYNLLGNALKFARPGVAPQVSVRARLATTEEHALYPHLLASAYWLIEVRDNGIGFDPRYAAQIFHIFQRLHGRQEYAGTGIGLALCKKVVTNHHGAISATSQPGAGAVFSVLLPDSPINGTPAP